MHHTTTQPHTNMVLGTRKEPPCAESPTVKKKRVGQSRNEPKSTREDEADILELSKNQCRVIPWMFYLLDDKTQVDIMPSVSEIPNRDGPMTDALLSAYSKLLITPLPKNKGKASRGVLVKISNSMHVYSTCVAFGNHKLVRGHLDKFAAKDSVCTCDKTGLHWVYIVGARQGIGRVSLGQRRYLNLGSVCIEFLDSKSLGVNTSLDRSLNAAIRKNLEKKKEQRRKKAKERRARRKKLWQNQPISDGQRPWVGNILDIVSVKEACEACKIPVVQENKWEFIKTMTKGQASNIIGLWGHLTRKNRF